MISTRIFPLLALIIIAVQQLQCVAVEISSCIQDDGECAETDEDDDVYTIAVCTATGQQGREVVKRLKEINPPPSKNFRIIGLTRSTSILTAPGNSNSSEESSNNGLYADDYVQTNYTTESLEDVFSSNNVDALFLNYVAIQEESVIEAGIIDAAVSTHVKHIIYSSTVGCDTNTGVGHWESSYQTESYLKKAAEGSADLMVHFVRLAHFNENILPGSYFEPNFKKGRIKYLWGADVSFATSSLRDAARVVAKLFVDPTLLPNGESIDAVTEMTTANDIANAVTLATGTTIKAAKGPWFFLKFGKLFGWMPKSIVQMAKYIEGGEIKANLEDMPKFLKDELDEEPLETIEKFALRHYGL